ncbi:hypothetical protein DC366_11145 [Pelagivirga sediminicola]|uniref:Uncharacterized protein n=1 Tax=Pelagivirga sediminicola TaxID=2170575 RepID=A0A2T7G713_9RHOB|nr:hypothetical protein [Pelagivirga sediminicola]PVA10193.1 hypothetical protein DC366_11145 [Pelagivirga sediminicola]
MVRPYDVAEPLLFGDVDQYIMAFARAKFASLAKGAISRMQRWEASGIFEGEADGLRSLWDEWCWYQANHSSDTPLLSDAIEETLDELIETVVSELSKTEAVLLTRAADAEAPDILHFEQHITRSNAMVSLCTKVGIYRFDQMLLEFAETMGLTKSDVEGPMRLAYNHLRDEMEIAGQDVSHMDNSKAVVAEVRRVLTEEGATPRRPIWTTERQAFDNAMIAEIVREVICEAASRRCLSRFEVN